MNALLDTNVVLRYTNRADPLHTTVSGFLDGFSASGGVPHICSQVIAEFWAIATRPSEANGLGFRASRAREEVDAIRGAWPFLPDPPTLLDRWLDLCTLHEVAGRKTYDARLVALMLTHGISTLITLNPGDFARFPEISLVVPGATPPAPVSNGPAAPTGGG